MPVWFMVKGLRLKEFKDERHNPPTKPASLPLPLASDFYFSKHSIGKVLNYQ
jgi:hypothetical protein